MLSRCSLTTPSVGRNSTSRQELEGPRAHRPWWHKGLRPVMPGPQPPQFWWKHYTELFLDSV
jgi:hypothetical protein